MPRPRRGSSRRRIGERTGCWSKRFPERSRLPSILTMQPRSSPGPGTIGPGRRIFPPIARAFTSREFFSRMAEGLPSRVATAVRRGTGWETLGGQDHGRPSGSHDPIHHPAHRLRRPDRHFPEYQSRRQLDGVQHRTDKPGCIVGHPGRNRYLSLRGHAFRHFRPGASGPGPASGGR